MSFANTGSQVESVVPAPREQSGAAQLATGNLAAVDRATEAFYAAVAELDAVAVRAPSLLPGWSRAHVISHVARNADALVNLLTWARTGVEHPAYTSRVDRDADIEEGSTRTPQLLRADLDSACLRFAAAAESLPASAWEAEVVQPSGGTLLAHQVPWLRLRELLFHLVDLDVGVDFDDLPEEHLEDLVDSVVGGFATRPDSPAVRIDVALPEGRQRSWELNTAGTDSSVTISGDAADVLGWLTGRHDGARLSGDVPKLPSWL
ncbi:maleylpyruvate isomerase family mycothiol-dependent enzyme [Umezawaea tangerina]|uniref:Maleylpyruvate isomerase n=1 Tax=Umezawaea tangerina TaxID=84725 RepID=A0A2T0T981_9PSEU|nr:maleylpyruvate isomerase family mycothiol-dependent enzyme [Umezawaea tangerina]PRY42223.1 maleylpyruvate isomerase [Umezawaea tangerina]